MNIDNIKPKHIVFITACFLALAMFVMETEQTTDAKAGHVMLLFGLNAGGIVLFATSGKMFSKDKLQGGIIFFFSILLRVFVGFYIEQLFKAEDAIFSETERYTMHAGNCIIFFIEMAYSFWSTEGHKVEEREEEWQRIVNDWEQHANKKDDELNKLRTQLEQKDEIINTLRTRAAQDAKILHKWRTSGIGDVYKRNRRYYKIDWVDDMLQHVWLEDYDESKKKINGHAVAA